MLRVAESLFALLLFASFVSFAQPAEKERPMERMREVRKDMKAKLNLTDAQQKEIQKLRIDLEKKQTQIHAKIRTERLDMKGAFLSDNPDRAAIEKGMKAVSDLEYQLKSTWLDHWYAVKSILTPEQQKTWKKEIGNFMEEGKGRGMGIMMHRQGMMKNRMGPKSWEDD